MTESLEQQYLADTKKEIFKIPVGEVYLEFLSNGERKNITYAEGDVKERVCYQINAFDSHGQSLAKLIEFAMPRTLLDAVSELRNQRGGSVIGGWLKVKRTGTDKLSTKYLGYPTVKPTW